MRELISNVQVTVEDLPSDSCYICQRLLKECICFEFQLTDDAMDHAFGRHEKHSFKAGGSVTAVPGLEPVQGSYVIARNKVTNQMVFRRYIAEDNKLYLEALNPVYPRITITSEIEIIGVIKAYCAYY